LPLLAALFWLALPGGRANAGLITYDFTGTGSSPQLGPLTISGSFEVDTQAIGSNGVFKATDLMNPVFTISDNHTYTVLDPSSSFQVDPTSFDVVDAELKLDSPSLPGFELDINGGPTSVWTELSEVPATGTGTWTHTAAVVVPAPPSVVMFGVGAVCLAGCGWRRRRPAPGASGVAARARGDRPIR
jgi:hypothetical protein